MPWIWASEHIYYDESHTLLVSGFILIHSFALLTPHCLGSVSQGRISTPDKNPAYVLCGDGCRG